MGLQNEGGVIRKFFKSQGQIVWRSNGKLSSKGHTICRRRFKMNKQQNYPPTTFM